MDYQPKREYAIIFANVAAFQITNITTFSEKYALDKSTMCDKKELSNDLFNRFWSWRLQNAPEFATAIGNHEYDDRLDEMSLPSYSRRRDAGQSFLDEIKTLLQSESPTDQATRLNLNLLKIDLESVIQGSEFHTYTFPINQLEGPQVDFPRLVKWAKKDNIDDYNKLFQRLRLFPRQIDETITLLKVGIEEKRTMHTISIDKVPDQLRDVANASVENTQFFQAFTAKPDNISTEEWTGIVDTGRKLIGDQVLAAYKKLADFIENEYKPKARTDIAATTLPNGHEYYKQCLRFHTSTNLTAKEIHDLGKREVNRISGKMIDVMKQVKFSGNLDEFKIFMETDAQFRFTTKEEMLEKYNEVTSNITKLLPSYFKRVPASRYIITEVPSAVAESFPAAYYLAPPEDGSRPGTFYLNTHKPESRNRYEAVALSLHEAEPGHHLQSALTMEQESLVEFRRFMEDRKYYECPGRFAINTAYVEGWGLYSEYLGEEMGLYSDPYDMFGRLSYEMLRACRLVVDTGMHALGWSRQQALDFMRTNTVASETEVTSEIDRYITWPGQACGYKVGELKIRELRRHAEVSLGDKFDLLEFHDMVASIGGVLMHVLEIEVEEFIKKFQ